MPSFVISSRPVRQRAPRFSSGNPAPPCRRQLLPAGGASCCRQASAPTRVGTRQFGFATCQRAPAVAAGGSQQRPLSIERTVVPFRTNSLACDPGLTPRLFCGVFGSTWSRVSFGAASSFSSAERSGSKRGARGNLSCSMLRRTAAATAACSSFVRIDCGHGSDLRPSAFYQVGL